MDTKAIQETLEKVIKETLPEVVETTVEAKMVEKFAGLEKQVADLNKNIKIGNDVDGKANLSEAKAKVGAYFKALAKCKNQNDIDQKTATFMNETTDAEGAYLVPTEFAKEVFRVAGSFGLVRKYARIIPMSTDTKNISSFVNDVVVAWTDEAGSYSESKPTIWQVALVAYKATALISATNELVDDNMTDQEVRTLMAELIAEKIAEFEDTNVLKTSSKFTALLADSNVNVITMANTKDSFADITYDNLIDLMRSVPVKYKTGTPRFFMHQDIIKHIEKIKDSHGDPIFAQTRSLKDGQIENTLLGKPLELTEAMTSDTADGALTPFILFGDLKFWAFGDRKQLSVSAWYMSGNWEKDIQSLKASERIAGKVIFAKAFAVLKTGTTTA